MAKIVDINNNVINIGTEDGGIKEGKYQIGGTL